MRFLVFDNFLQVACLCIIYKFALKKKVVQNDSGDAIALDKSVKRIHSRVKKAHLDN